MTGLRLVSSLLSLVFFNWSLVTVEWLDYARIVGFDLLASGKTRPLCLIKENVLTLF